MYNIALRRACGVVLCLYLSTGAKAASEGGVPVSFSATTVEQVARDLSARPYEPAPKPVADASLTYDAYRDVRFKPGASIWRATGSPYEIQLMPAGWLFENPIKLNLVEDGVARAVEATPDMFDVGPQAAAIADRKEWPLSGFRITGYLNEPGKRDEVIVFQGASYFRALSKGQIYGTSARGLAIGSGRPAPEEFPIFKEFWVERAPRGATRIVVHALMDSPSVTGAYRFEVQPGSPTNVRVAATLFPRVEITDVGLAPLTSMHLLSPSQPARVSDFRPRVHDAEGLAMVNGNGEHLWRPLRNPRHVEMSLFADDNPRGFGLIQRERMVDDYLDFEAHYERRPSTWIEPMGNWGRGSVVLVELPTEEEINDNIVAFWRPETPLLAGKPYKVAYLLAWPDVAPNEATGAWVERSLMGKAHGDDGKNGLWRFAIDYRGLSGHGAAPKVAVTTTSGAITTVTVQKVEELGVVRVAFLLDPGAAPSAELRVAVDGPSKVPAETWLYRWARD